MTGSGGETVRAAADETASVNGGGNEGVSSSIADAGADGRTQYQISIYQTRSGPYKMEGVVDGVACNGGIWRRRQAEEMVSPNFPRRVLIPSEN